MAISAALRNLILTSNGGILQTHRPRLEKGQELAFTCGVNTGTASPPTMALLPPKAEICQIDFRFLIPCRLPSY